MKSYTLKDACYITTGKLDANQSIKNGIYPFFTCAEFPDAINTYAFDCDAVLVAGNNARGNFHVNRYKGKFNAYQRTYVLTSKENFDIDFIFYSLKLELKRLKEKSQGSQTKFLTLPILQNIHFSSILINEQKSIATVLSALDKKIALNKQINARLEEMAKILYDYWFVQFDFPDANGKPYKSSGGEMVFDETLKREIPKGWEVKSLWKIAKYFNGLALQKYRPENELDDFLPVIKIREMNEGVSSNTERAKTNIPKEAIIDDGDILFSWSATLEIKIWSQGKGALNQHIFKVTSSEYPKYFFYFELLNYLKHFKMIADLRKTTMGHITQDHLKQAYICIPSQSSLENLERIVTPIFQKMLITQKQNYHLTQLRDFLLPMLMNGQVSVAE
ncbi:restriction endonuclease subunit S [Cardiobacterium sp. Marseille-Q4385]|uniref:restriction endonuclease subunit S n=1 Tax=Cardiobacterium sp. Marseille-Q4385 TaxID=2866573 RepID=UPI001CE40DED|nr:restriction endonuclease subunit S [Cardiobacterium sp. Marseille-Q4385]